jgi:hypothetical protein
MSQLKHQIGIAHLQDDIENWLMAMLTTPLEIKCFFKSWFSFSPQCPFESSCANFGDFDTLSKDGFIVLSHFVPPDEDREDYYVVDVCGKLGPNKHRGSLWRMYADDNVSYAETYEHARVYWVADSLKSFFSQLGRRRLQGMMPLGVLNQKSAYV